MQCQKNPLSSQDERVHFSSAVMAQRKGELLKMALLEKLAGLRIELQADYDSAQES